MSSIAELSAKPIAKERIYIWQLPVRLVHWVLFFSILILSGTGYYIGHPFISVPGPAKEHFVMGTMRAIHLYTAFVFSAAVLFRVYWFFAGNRYARLPEFIPLTARRWRGLWRTFLYYCFLKPYPEVYPGHDALAASTYGFIFLIYFLLMATGLALYIPIASVSGLRFSCADIRRLADGTADPSYLHVCGVHFCGDSHLFGGSVVDHRRVRRDRFDI
jgi:Ni/Fe-hydrogenase b-type cytochrome subunit